MTVNHAACKLTACQNSVVPCTSTSTAVSAAALCTPVISRTDLRHYYDVRKCKRSRPYTRTGRLHMRTTTTRACTLLFSCILAKVHLLTIPTCWIWGQTFSVWSKMACRRRKRKATLEIEEMISCAALSQNQHELPPSSAARPAERPTNHSCKKPRQMECEKQLETDIPGKHQRLGGTFINHVTFFVLIVISNSTQKTMALSW